MPAKDYQCNQGCPLARWQTGIPATHDEPGESGGWYCKVTAEFIPEHKAPLIGCCYYFDGYQAGHEHPLDVALGCTTDAGDKAAVEWLAEHVPSHLLFRAWQAAPESAESRATRLHHAAMEFQYSPRSGQEEN